jgi:hypothetical protein
MPRSSTTWDPVKARSASIAGVEARRRNRAYRLANPPAIPSNNPVAPGLPPAEPQSFISKRLARVRAQLDRLDALLANATEPKAIKELADATTRLQAQEQQLAGRPGPGTLKPVAPGAARTPAYSPAVPLPPLPNAPNQSSSSALPTFGRDALCIPTPLPKVDRTPATHTKSAPEPQPLTPGADDSDEQDDPPLDYGPAE